MYTIQLINIKNTFLIAFVSVFSLISCQSQKKETAKQDSKKVIRTKPNQKIVMGANQTQHYLSLLTNKNIGVVANQTSVIFKNDLSYTHLVDSLVHLNLTVKKVFAPEHGFRGKADAGEHIGNGKDVKTGVDIISIYGKNKKPSKEQLAGLDILVFDIQDVGARFYTYISSLHYIMEACAENNIPLLILDRPNPNGHYIDGPILKTAHKSFVGMHPIPIVHGMTIGEYAKMINGQNWLNNNLSCDITIVKCLNYTKETPYELPIKPSPNLPNSKAINLYPSLCFFEGTTISVGRGTEMQFQIYGAPFLPKSNFNFTPNPNEGAKYPKHQNKTCNGFDLRNVKKLNALELKWLISAYQNTKDQSKFFNKFFTKLAGTKLLQQQIEKGLSEVEIRKTWQKGLSDYEVMRKQYLLY